MSDTRRTRAQFHASVSVRALAVSGVLALSMGWAASAAAQAAADSSKPDTSGEVAEVVVTGFRASVTNALESKRTSDTMIDAINAQDIADFPDANLAESLQRLPGVSIDRDNGEGRTITVRGLGSDFTRVRLNGLEALSTAGSNDSGTAPNRGRGFDFNTFASELFSSLKVQKTASAETDEGSLGATIDLQTTKPFDFKGPRLALGVQDAWYEAGKHNNPRVTGLVSDRWTTRFGEIGVLASVAYNTRDTTSDSYLRQAGQSDYAYRGATFATTPNPANGLSTLTRQGFAAPTGTPCNQIIPGVNITNASLCDALRGSSPAAYALVNSPQGATLSTVNGVTSTTAPGSLVRIPALPTIQQQLLHQDRLGMTGTLQWRPTERTTVTFDTVYSRFYNNSQNFQIQVVGLNRNNTTAGLNTATAGTAAATKRGLYNTCTARAATDIQDAIDCGQQMNGTTPVAGTLSGFSFNPHNLEPYDYYNSPSSVGFVPDPLGLALRNNMIGRPSVRLIDAGLDASGQAADYLKLGGVDVRSADDQSIYTTFFRQNSIRLEHEFSDDLKLYAEYGQSRSVNKNEGLLADYIRLDSGQGVPGNDYLVYDDRGHGSMPILNLGFDPANPASWDFVKNYSALRHFERTTDNRFKNARFDVNWRTSDDLTLKVGASYRKYGFFTTQYQRLVNETLNPSFREANSSVADTSRLINFGHGIDVPAGTPTSFLAPDIDKFRQLLGFDCNCVNQWGDWRLSYLSNAANTYGVDEKDTGGYAQADFRHDLFGITVRGNVGLRYAHTDVQANGLTNTARPVSGSNTYDDWLPSVNLVFQLTDDLYLRGSAAKVMARPLLANLAPSVTAFSVPSSAGANSGGSITVGNPQLQPFRAKNYDADVEWYFAKGAVFSVAVFDKEISSFPQTITASAPLSSFLTADQIAQLRASQTNVNAVAYIDADLPFDVRQFRDAPGGHIRGVEVNYQQNLTFLPYFLKNLGVLANYTHIASKLNYIIDPGSSATATTAARPRKVASGPFTGASPDAFNFTVYYEVEKWSARLSSAYRSQYYTQYPIASGTCDPGFCDSPLVNDFLGSKSTLNVDGNFTYNFSDHLTLSVDILNITNQRSERFAYATDPVTALYQQTGRQVFAGLRFTW
ncbi:MAG: TonB-dependent receptor [Caulobacterales bacterium]|nr:TonB-dependent receptor [Caulobacterales bacterium]